MCSNPWRAKDWCRCSSPSGRSTARSPAPWSRARRLPWEVKDLFRYWLERHYPLKAKHVMARIRDMRGGRDNDPNFGSRMKGEGQFAELLRNRFALACRRLGLNAEKRDRLDGTKFRRLGGPQGAL